LTQKDRVIILRKTKYGEADLIVQGLTTRGSKISFLARGALKSKKRFGGGVLEPTHYISVSYKKRSEDSQQLAVLEEASLLEAFEGLRTDYDRLQMALVVTQIIARIGQEGDEHSESLFNLLGHTLKALEKTKRLDFLRLHFIIKLLHQQGVLEVDGWMMPLLKTPINENEKLVEPFGEYSAHLRLLDSMLENYLKSAQI
jgi:DNA repair protein RecO (recombination protein O)